MVLADHGVLGELGNIFFTVTPKDPDVGNVSTTIVAAGDAFSEA